jgi:hypothetical protein
VSSQENIDIFRWTARRAAQRPSFVAADLGLYTAIHEISEEELAELLSCPEEALTDLALCRRPDPSKPNFKTEVQRLASFVGCDGARLVQLLREVDTVNTFRAAERSQGDADAGLLAAARDARDKDPESSSRSAAKNVDENDENPEPR